MAKSKEARLRAQANKLEKQVAKKKSEKALEAKVASLKKQLGK